MFQLIQLALQLLGLLGVADLLLRAVVVAQDMTIAPPVACIHERQRLLVIQHSTMRILRPIQVAPVNLHLVSLFLMPIINE